MSRVIRNLDEAKRQELQYVRKKEIRKFIDKINGSFVNLFRNDILKFSISYSFNGLEKTEEVTTRILFIDLLSNEQLNKLMPLFNQLRENIRLFAYKDLPNFDRLFRVQYEVTLGLLDDKKNSKRTKEMCTNEQQCLRLCKKTLNEILKYVNTNQGIFNANIKIVENIYKSVSKQLKNGKVVVKPIPIIIEAIQTELVSIQSLRDLKNGYINIFQYDFAEKVTDFKPINNNDLLNIHSTQNDNEKLLCLENTGSISISAIPDCYEMDIGTKNVQEKNLKLSVIDVKNLEYIPDKNIGIPEDKAANNKETLDEYYSTDDNNTKKITRNVNLSLRNITIVKKIKEIYSHKCQICDETIQIGSNEYLSEAHHIHPLSENGEDSTSNLILLCPNHHTMFDYGMITIDLENKVVIHANPVNLLNSKLINIKHYINPKNVVYHNEHIFIQILPEYIQNTSNNNALDMVKYGDIVTFKDSYTNEIFNVQIEMKYNSKFMTPIQKNLLGCSLYDKMRISDFEYIIVDIKGI